MMCEQNEKNEHQKENDIDTYKVNAFDVITIKYVTIPNEVEKVSDTPSYLPKFVHQIVGDDETIFGYKGLSIAVYFSVFSFRCFLNIEYEEKYSTAHADDNELKAADIRAMFKPYLPEETTTSKEEFISWLNEEPFSFYPLTLDLPKIRVPFIHLNCANEEDEIVLVRMNLIDQSSTPPTYKDIYRNLESIVIFEIDAANGIDDEDDGWTVYLLLKKSEKCRAYFVLGVATAYKFFAFPDNWRYRISHFMICHPYRNSGFGHNFLKSIYFDLSSSMGENVRDIEIETPNEQMVSLRNEVLLDCMLKNEIDRIKIHERLRNHAKLLMFMCKHIAGMNGGDGIENATSSLYEQITRNYEKYVVSRELAETDEKINEAKSIARKEFEELSHWVRRFLQKTKNNRI